MLTTEYLITSFIVVLMPGSGVIFTVSIGLIKGGKASIFAAIGCTVGIVPHLIASVFGLSAILHASALVFQVFKLIGVLYLLYLAWSLWRESESKEFYYQQKVDGNMRIALRAFLINILNPKLSIFFLAFLPQFVPVGVSSPLSYLLVMSAVFMVLTLFVFIGYGLLANHVRHYILESPKIMQGIQRVFAGLFVVLGAKLAAMER
ncbi:MAG: LysE family translocator [Chromatiales bacterium]|nr:LysE family translocator [Chromatiales bacterium]